MRGHWGFPYALPSARRIGWRPSTAKLHLAVTARDENHAAVETLFERCSP